ncbi:unnamed protein product, partial [marine sediment metagenome]
ADRAEEAAKQNKDVILVRVETNPSDFHGMAASNGILTMKGGLTSHAAIVARQIGKACVVGSERGEVMIDEENRELRGNGIIVKEGDLITIDGIDGSIYALELPTRPAGLTIEMAKILQWADEFAKLRVIANADKPDQFRTAIEFGAQGIGLTRTEHMFFDNLDIVQEMILARTETERQAAVDKLEPLQQADFEGLFEAAEGKPITIRLIDPPLHEFLSNEVELLTEIYESRLKGKTKDNLKEQYEMLEQVRLMKEQNPMLGLRGCRLGITMPIVTEMQSKAIFRAAAKVKKLGKEV